jgi:heme A synthase
VYWPTALVLAYVVIAAFYIRRSQARGVGTRVRPYVVAGIILALAMTGSLVWALYHPLASTLAGPGPFSAGPVLHSYSFAIGLALVVLAWAERNGALLALALGYLAVVLVTATVGPVSGHGWLGWPVQLVIPGSVLLLGGIGFLRAQRPWRHAA